MNPRISLIICAYNEERYIGECLDYALKNSSDKLFEIIVIDNASTDGTRSKAEQFPGVRVVTEPNKGLTRARQRGFMEARGDILAYIDADTHMPEGWVDRIVKEFNENQNLACLSGPYIYYDLPKWQQMLVKTYWYALGMPVYMILGYMVVGGNFAIRKKVLEKMNGFDTSIEFYGEDTNIARRAHNFGKVKFAPTFPMLTSGRRLTNHGLARTSALYMLNYLSEAVRHKPATSSYKDIR